MLSTRNAAITALMAITTVNEGKHAFCNAGGCPLLCRLLEIRHPVLRVNVMTLIMNAGEDPKSRAQLQPAVPLLRDIVDTATDEVHRRFAQQCLRQTEFEHRPFEDLPQPVGGM